MALGPALLKCMTVRVRLLASLTHTHSLSSPAEQNKSESSGTEGIGNKQLCVIIMDNYCVENTRYGTSDVSAMSVTVEECSKNGKIYIDHMYSLCVYNMSFVESSILMIVMYDEKEEQWICTKVQIQ